MVEIKRWKDNPLLRDAHDLPWCRSGIRNPGAVMDGDAVRMLFTANACRDSREYGRMRLGYAESRDGFRFECRPDPFLDPSGMADFTQ